MDELSSKANDRLVEDYQEFLYWDWDKVHTKSCPETFHEGEYEVAMF